MIVIDKQTGNRLTNAMILAEVNRDRSEDWQDYNIDDLINSPSDLADWIDTTYYEVIL